MSQFIAMHRAFRNAIGRALHLDQAELADTLCSGAHFALAASQGKAKTRGALHKALAAIEAASPPGPTRHAWASRATTRAANCPDAS